MNYKTLKKVLMPELDQKMKELGYIRKKTTTPTYWTYPSDDKRLAWVVCFNFSHRGNPLFDVLITPYWIPSNPEDERFPRGVGYIGYLCPTGFSTSQHTWWTRSPEAAEQSIDEVVLALAGPGSDWFRQFDTPQNLLAAYPSPKLAADLDDLDLAAELYRDALFGSFVQILTQKKTTHATPYESLRDWEKARHERIISEYLDVLQRNGSNPEAAGEKVATIELDALTRERQGYAESLQGDPRSRWYKSQIRYCDARISELSWVR